MKILPDVLPKTNVMRVRPRDSLRGYRLGRAHGLRDALDLVGPRVARETGLADLGRRAGLAVDGSRR